MTIAKSVIFLFTANEIIVDATTTFVVEYFTYFDIDMTRNDIGTYGGPHSMDNYWDTTSLGVARIFGLDMPFELWPAQNPTIKADAVHRK